MKKGLRNKATIVRGHVRVDPEHRGRAVVMPGTALQQIMPVAYLGMNSTV